MYGLQAFDYFRKLPQDQIQRTLTGSMMSIVAMVTMTVLFANEMRQYWAPEIVSEMQVHSKRGLDSKVNVNIDITIHDTPCSVIALDVGMQNRLLHVADVPLVKTRLDAAGNVLTKPTNAYDVKQIEDGIINREKCRLKGTF